MAPRCRVPNKISARRHLHPQLVASARGTRVSERIRTSQAAPVCSRGCHGTAETADADIRAAATSRIAETTGETMDQSAQPSDLELAALISSKICHDVIGPVGAIYNGLEILDEDDDAEGEVLRAGCHPQRHRAGFGAAPVRALCVRRRGIGRRGDRPRHRRADQPRAHRHRASTSSPGAASPGYMAKDKVKLLLNLIASAITALPRGGEIIVEFARHDRGAELPAALPRRQGAPASVPDRLYHPAQQPPALDAMSIQAYYTMAACQQRADAARHPEGRRRHPAFRRVRRLIADSHRCWSSHCPRSTPH